MRYANMGFPRPWRLASSTVCSAALLLAANCGGDASGTAMLAEDVGRSLAAETAEVEEALAASDHAAAEAEALDLRERVNAAIEAGEIPASLRRPLLAAVNRLIASIPKDDPPPEDEEKDEEKDEDDEKGKGNGKDKGNADDEGATSTDVTTIVETLTDGSDDG
jgi:hypothetical protein